MTKKLYDLAVKVGTYKDKSGETKGRYMNVGALLEGDNGKYLVLDRTFNPAGVPNEENRSNLIISMFKPKDGEGAATSQHSAAKADGYAPKQQSIPADDDIPF